VDAVIAKELRVLANKIIAWLTDIMEEGRVKKIFRFRSSPRTKALMIAGTMLASVQLTRVTGSKDFMLIKEGIIDELMY
jgi:3-oxoacyl-[acyl-carrier-protein] synthase II/TetR/AcrR family transcriptional repressor of nem operon